MTSSHTQQIWTEPRCLVFIALATVLVYLNALGNGFVWRDVFFICQKGGIVESFGDALRLLTAGLYQTAHEAYYRPMMLLSFSLDYALWGLRPAGFHLTNIVIHTLNCLLLFFITKQMFRTTLPRLVTCLFFAVHPLHTASVSYITNRLDIICFFFIVLCWYLCEQSLRGRSGIGTFWCLLGTHLCYICALLSKETALVFPVLFGLYVFLCDRTLLQKSKRTLTMHAFLFIVISIAYLYIRFYAVHTFGVTTPHRPGLVPTMITILADYVLLSLAPLIISTSDGAHIIHSLWSPLALASLLIIVCLIILALINYRRKPLLTFALAWFFITLLPVLNIVPILYLRSDHFLYMPLLAPGLIMGMCVDNAATKAMRMLTLLCVVLILFGYSWKTIERNRDWYDDRTLFNATLAIDPDCKEARAERGLVYYRDGHYEEAMREFTIAATPVPGYYSYADIPRMYANKGNTAFQLGHFLEAEHAYAQALQLSPNNAAFHLERGHVFFEQKKYAQALDAFTQALTLEPTIPFGTCNLGITYYQLGKYQEAINTLDQALTRTPDDAIARHYRNEAVKKLSRSE